MLLLLGLTAAAACRAPAPPQNDSAPSFIIDPDRVTVSGISSGAYMAGQLHVAHSELIGGAALLAGGPYWCAGGSVRQALGPCTRGGAMPLTAIVEQVGASAVSGAIDPPENLQDDRVWLFHGAADEAVARSVSAAAEAFYRANMPREQIAFVDSVEAVHGMPTESAGAPCNEFAPPYINACGYDAAGELLRHLYGRLSEPVVPSGELHSLDQRQYAGAELWDHAYLYVPASCAEGAECSLHVAFHGCQQSAELVGDAFATSAGYNEWAEANGILILYPQVRSSSMAPLNPLGCWDWWGYTGENYATRQGPQVAAVRSMIDALMKAD